MVFQVATVELTPSAAREYDHLPTVMKARVGKILVRLEKWPAVSGAKALRGELKKNFRVRTGDYRIILQYAKSTDVVLV